MAFKPNYNQQRAERKRAKDQKKQEKLRRREEEVAKRKAAQESVPSAAGDSGTESPRAPLESPDGP